MTIVAVDPGPLESALVVIEEDGRVTLAVKELNESIRKRLRTESFHRQAVIEMVQAMGMPVGAEVFETVFWIGRFAESCANAGVVMRLNRRDVKQHFCNSDKAKDANIRQALLDRYGGNSAARGKKKSPGPLYGVKGDCWQALAVGLVAMDRIAATRARVA